MSKNKGKKQNKAEMAELKSLAEQVERQEAEKKSVATAKNVGSENGTSSSTPEEPKAKVDPEIQRLAQMQAIEEIQGAKIVFTDEQAKLVSNSASDVHSKIMDRVNKAADKFSALQLETVMLVADRERLALTDKLWLEKYGRVSMVKSRLEKLCKDLDAHMKAQAARHDADVAEVARNLNEKHVEQLKNSQEVIERVITQMNATVAENERVATENQEIRSQYNKLAEFIKNRDTQLANLEKLTKARDTAVDEKLSKQSSLLEEQSNHLRDTLTKLTASTKREAILQKQVEAYAKQIGEAQNVLKSSTEVVTKLKKDRDDLESKLISTQKLAIAGQEDNKKLMQELALVTRNMVEMKEKNDKLSALCSKLLSKSKETGNSEVASEENVNVDTPTTTTTTTTTSTTTTIPAEVVAE